VHTHKNDKSIDPEEAKTRKNVEFARDLFISWDDNGDGNIDEQEIIMPLVSLGLAPDSKFAKKICQALDPRNKA
jgi:Ca2+-binding EF-hand superfamily protein